MVRYGFWVRRLFKKLVIWFFGVVRVIGYEVVRIELGLGLFLKVFW